MLDRSSNLFQTSQLDDVPKDTANSKEPAAPSYTQARRAPRAPRRRAVKIAMPRAAFHRARQFLGPAAVGFALIHLASGACASGTHRPAAASRTTETTVARAVAPHRRKPLQHPRQVRVRVGHHRASVPRRARTLPLPAAEPAAETAPAVTSSAPAEVPTPSASTASESPEFGFEN